MADTSKIKSYDEKNTGASHPKNESAEHLKSLEDMVVSSDSAERKRAALWMGEEKHFNLGHFSLLKRLIKDEDEEVWNSASIALGRFAFANDKAHDYLNNLIEDDYLWLNKRGIRALREYAKYDHRGIDHITQLTATARKEIVEEAVLALCNVAQENDVALGALKGLLESNEELILQPAILSMGILAREKKQVLSELKPLLKYDNNFIRLWAASAIGEAAGANDSAFSIYKNFIDHEDVYLRRGFSKGLTSISKYRPDEAMKMIDMAIEDNDRYVRTNAVQALAFLTSNKNQAFSRIQELLDDDKADVRRGAAEAVLAVPEGMEGEIKPLIKRIVKDEDYYLRGVAAFATAKIADSSPKEALKLMEKLVDDRDEYVRRDLALAIGNMKGNLAADAFPSLLKLLDDRENIVKREATKSLRIVAKVKTDEILELMPNLIQDIDEGVRENTAEVAGYIAQQEAKEAFLHLRKLVGDESPSVREKAAKGMEKVFDSEPDSFFVRMRILQKDGVDPEILRLISKFAKNEEISEVCALWAELTEVPGESNLESKLIEALEVLGRISTLKHSHEVEKVFKTFLHGIRARNINDIALVKFDSEPIKTIYASVDSQGSSNFEVLEMVPEMALRYKQIEGLSDKHIYMGKMLSSIDTGFENLPEEKYLEMDILNQVLHNWRVVLSSAMDALKGSANLKIVLRTKKVLPLDTLTLLLGIENTGESLAENLMVRLMPSPSYKIIDKTGQIGMLGHNRKDAVEFRIKPTKKRDFRVRFRISYDDFEMMGKSMDFADRVSFIDIPRDFRYIPNPYITGGPIKPNSKEMFFGRDDVFQFIRNNISSISQKNVLILQGERRTGKTSILYQIPDMLGSEYICAFLDGQEFGGSTLDYFLYKMAKRISSTCEKQKIKVSSPSKKAFLEDPWYVFKDQFLEDLGEALGDRYLVILFDEFESLEHAVKNGIMDPMIFSYIRNLMQHEDKLVFIFAGVHRLEEMMQDYWDVMFNIALYCRIGFLKESETRKLITYPVDGYYMLYDDLAQEKIIRATACHPYFVQLLCRFLVNRHNTEKRNYITVQDVNEELVNVIEKAKPHFDYIWTLSSSDERMLLALLADLLRKKNIITMADILDEYGKNNLKVSKRKISSALKSLTARDILERVSNGAVHYQFKVDFIRMWIERHQPLSKVMEEQGEELGGK
ncbi:MAG: HEAT repeat domain-containing protein [Methanomassiliicoccales archaeon]|nr:MAG: HEAT repeat domain-containing protein [Methanomassiliicoccales archaeon]